MKARVPQNSGTSMNEMLKKAQLMQSQAEEKQAELDEREYSAESAGGLISVTVTGKHKLVNLSINPEAVDVDDLEMLEDLIMATVNKANEEADSTAEAEMGAITSGLDLSSLPGGLGSMF